MPKNLVTEVSFILVLHAYLDNLELYIFIIRE